MAAETSDIVLFVGRTGNGKSSTIRSIHTTDITDDTFALWKQNLVLVKSSGIGDTGSDSIADVEKLKEWINEMITDGFTALVFVLRYGVRFTQQEKNAVLAVKSIFGEDVFKHWGIIVMTYGDNFELDLEDDPDSFEDWCRSQTGDFQTLYDECKSRSVLFNNKTKDIHKLQMQVNNFKQHVDNVKSGSRRYSTTNYIEAHLSRQRFFDTLKFLKIQQETYQLIEKINNQNDVLENTIFLNDLVKIKLMLEEKKTKCRELDNESPEVQQLIQTVSIAETKVDFKLLQVRNLIEYDEEKACIGTQGNLQDVDSDWEPGHNNYDVTVNRRQECGVNMKYKLVVFLLLASAVVAEVTLWLMKVL
ncbi:GTPase IMAP family member 9-like [Physella acuta]|uniref:GTPase IMAP family member 9-like n=1 Tax=Physella acuta TaxID=109671 RepID=UPI0027DC3FDC|nr:GTPase IMAP family member 9-like [Physella acuta]